MITVKVYPNGYEINGHDDNYFCAQVSMWHYCTAHLLDGNNCELRNYESAADVGHENDGYSWLVYNNSNGEARWIFDDMVICLQKWNAGILDNRINIEFVDSLLSK